MKGHRGNGSVVFPSPSSLFENSSGGAHQADALVLDVPSLPKSRESSISISMPGGENDTESNNSTIVADDGNAVTIPALDINNAPALTNVNDTIAIGENARGFTD